jgi:competence protein ComEC
LKHPGPQSAATIDSGSAFRLAPLMAAALAFSAGILFARFISHPFWIWIAAALLIATGAALLARSQPRIAYCATLVCLAIVGSFTSTAREAATHPDLSLQRFANGSEVVITARVVRDGYWRDSPYGGRDQSVDLEVNALTTADGVPHKIAGGLRLSVFARHPRAADYDDSGDGIEEAPLFPTFLYGQQLRLTAKLHTPLNYGNPGAFDYRGYLLSDGIVAVGSARAESIEVVPGFAGSRSEQLRWRVRRSVIAHIHRTWPAEKAALMDAMLIGERAFVSRDLRDAFQRSGTYHILVVSGMNIGILAFVIFWLLRRFRMGAALATAATVLLSCGYAYLTDAGAPIVRSVLMLAIYLVTQLLYRDRAPLNAVGLAALAILVIDPRALLEPSFQLTFISVAAIAGIGVPLIERTSQPYTRALRMLDVIDYDRSFPPKVAQFRLDLRFISGRLRGVLGTRFARTLVSGICSIVLAAYELLLISALMQVSLALPMAWYFHRATSMALPANILVVPLTGLLMPSAVGAVALSYLGQAPARIPALIAGLSLDGITGTVRLFGTMRVADLRIPMPTMTVAVIAALAFAAALLLSRRHRFLLLFGISALAISAFLVAAWHPAPGRRPGALEITAIDVGQGDSLLIVTPEGKFILLDSGGHLGNATSNFDVGEDVVSPYLWQRGIRHLDAVAISHAHSDHMGGMQAVVRNFQPSELWMGKSAETSDLKALRDTASAYGTTQILRAAGNSFDFGGADDWELKPRVRDDDAMILRISYGQNSVLLPGDASRKIEQQLASRYGHIDLLKVPHHGSQTSTSPELLDAIQPEFAVISVGARNTFRHPRPEVLARLQAAHVATYRTDTLGAVSFFLDGNSIRVERTLR